MVHGKTKGVYPAAKALLSAVYEGAQVPFDTALKIEARYFTSVLMNPSSSAMIRSLFINKSALEKGANRPGVADETVQKVGILGLGRIGQAIARKLEPFNAEIVYHSRSRKPVDYTYYDNLTAMALDVEVLVCITPGGAATNKLVNAEVLAALGPTGTLINVSRGSVVDEEALITALQTGQLGWAGLDVFVDEPNVPSALCDMPNVVLLPHVGSATHETRAAMGKLTVDNLLQFLRDGSVISPVPECAG